MPPRTVCIVCARDEAARIGATLDALRAAFSDARILVADDGSTDATASIATARGAEVIATGSPVGKGGAASRAARRVLALALAEDPPVFVFCDADLGETARALVPLAAAVRAGRADLAVGALARREGGGFGVAVGAARRVIARLTGLGLRAPLSGQRALAGHVLPVVVPFAARFGMEVGMTVDAARAGFRILELELPLAHRPTGRTPEGFLHRGRQLADVIAVVLSRA
jgi:glycosyltransferase involved in cell wall biosynthesis